MNKKLIRLTEADLHRIVKESVDKVLNEMNSFENPNKYGGSASGDSPFANNHSLSAHNFVSGGADSYWARKHQDDMHKKEQDYMKRNTKRAMDAADKRPLHRKDSLNRA